ncbi:aspartyl/asparaginyl beta-hydroxylase domain-containing protein [Burkholderia anthina]|uniref:Aspartyl/asparaginyl beta-hydroxylase domain-containing protein n=1 Tax=Burkholderia anthina TaxID=179879 RepID=A0A7T6VH76_9BURK|nr:aspartyl/asparaginyl beta-hydroxylase domain-containing protein [Burkholderia anthina]QQK03845.1 aspartyl/asparaginyl beta-hydroxylase domain-containing protein [Burkholderia anthina]
MKFFRKLPYQVDVRELNAQLAASPNLWGEFSRRKTQPGTPHSRMTDIWVRYNDVRKAPYCNGDFSTFNDEHVPVWYRAWRILPALHPIIFDLMSRVQGEMLGGVLITRIPDGQGIDPHIDRSWHVDYYDKFYISLESAPGAEFWCGEEFINPVPGDVYHFDNRLEHWVINRSGRDRVTLIVCIRTEMFRGKQS